MKAEIKFTLFVDSRLTDRMALDKGLRQAFLAAMHNLGTIQQYCILYRAKQRATGDGHAFDDLLREYVNGFYAEGVFDEDPHRFRPIDAFWFAIKEAEARRVRCEVFERSGAVVLCISFFPKADGERIFSLDLSWRMDEGKVKGSCNGCIYPNGGAYPEFYTSCLASV